jgi:hypothetical protein
LSAEKVLTVKNEQKFVKYGDYGFDNIQLNKEFILITGSSLSNHRT